MTNTNLALNKPVKASYVDESDKKPEKAVNGTCNNLSDKWFVIREKAYESWLMVDLGEIVKINRWLVIHEEGSGLGIDGHFTSDFCLEGSYDGVKWNEIDAVVNNTDGITNRYLRNTIQARYLRLKINKGDCDNSVRIYEFQLYND